MMTKVRNLQPLKASKFTGLLLTFIKKYNEPMSKKVLFSLFTIAFLSTTQAHGLCINETVDVKRNSWRSKKHQAITGRMKRNSKPNKITIHYTGTDLSKIKRRPIKDTLRGLYNYSVNSKNWGDIPYHYYIDRNGTSAETRDPKYQADTNTNYNPNGHITIVVQGGPSDKLNNKQKQKLFKMIQGLQNKYNIQTSDVGVHKNHASTQCPGDHIAGLIEEYKRKNASYRPRPGDCGKKAQAPVVEPIADPSTTST